VCTDTLVRVQLSKQAGATSFKRVTWRHRASHTVTRGCLGGRYRASQGIAWRHV